MFRLVLEPHDGKGLGADPEEKREPVSDIDIAVVDSLKALDPEWPIREADLISTGKHVRVVPLPDLSRCSKLSDLLDHLVGAGEQSY